MSKIIGIDLGSTLSEVSVMEGGHPVIIINEEGSRTTPSVISFKGDECKIGAAAKRQAITSPKETVVLIKRFMGGTFDEVKDSIFHVQYTVINRNGYPKIVINNKEYSPEELSAMILSKMKKIAEDYLGEKVTDAIITVPAYFNDAQRQATKKAGEIAGLNVKRIIAEPTAALLASSIDKKKGGKFMVVDYGGATLDFSIADVSDNVIEILSSNGDVFCGGSDIDRLLSQWILDEFKKQTAIDLSSDSMAMSRVYEAAEKAKIELSNSTTTDITLPYITAIEGNPYHLSLKITRAEFDKIIDKEIEKVISLGKEALKKANLDNIDGILLVGGSTRIPKVQAELEKAFHAPLIKNINPDEAVALGAAVQGSIINGEKDDILLLDVTPLTLGIETLGGVIAPIIEANTTIPVSKSQIFTTAADNQPSVTISVYQGNRPLAKDNKKIGMFNLDGIAPALRGVPQIEVTFDIDVNGILSVSAVDKGTGKEQHVKIETASGISDEDIQRMKKEAEENNEKDEQIKKRIEAINESESLIYQAEKILKESSDKLNDDDKQQLNTCINNAKEKIKGENISDIQSSNNELSACISSILSHINQSNNVNN